MASAEERFDFASDNTAAICPPAWAALTEANADGAVSYGDDKWTRRAIECVREIFEIDCEVFLIFNGTAANALALAHLARSYHGVICHENAHSQTDECGAPEFFSGGGKLIPTAGANGKLDLNNVRAALVTPSRCAFAEAACPQRHPGDRIGNGLSTRRNRGDLRLCARAVAVRAYGRSPVRECGSVPRLRTEIHHMAGRDRCSLFWRNEERDGGRRARSFF